ncbi:MAG: hypothetical protein V4633_18370 [Pseudomonadota bacterium]
MEAKSTAPAGPKPAAAKPKVVIEAYSFRRQGWPYIRKSANVFLVCLLISVLMVGAGRFVLFRTKPDTMGAAQKQSAARDRLNQAEAERIEIRDFLPKFEQLRARGFFGPENRLAMLEAIRDIQKRHRLLLIEYNFEPQQIVAVDAALLGPELELHSTAVQFKMKMLHELDLVNIMRDLKQAGFFSVKECDVLAEEPQTETAPRLLGASCTLYWLTIGPPTVVAPEGVVQ